MRATGRSEKRKRDKRYKRKLKKLYSLGSIRTAVLFIDTDCRYKTVNKPYYQKCYKSRPGGRYSTYKKVANRKVRHYNGDLSSGNSYKKVFDLWWQIY